MSKIGIVLIVLMMITVGFFSGCSTTDNQECPYKLDFLARYSPTNSIIVTTEMRGTIYVRYIVNTSDVEANDLADWKLKEINYVIYGNGNYAGNGTITKDPVGRTTVSRNKVFNQIVRVYEINYSKEGNPWEPIIPISEELRYTLENELPVEWTISGNWSLYSPDNKLTKIPLEDLTYYQTTFD